MISITAGAGATTVNHGYSCLAGLLDACDWQRLRGAKKF